MENKNPNNFDTKSEIEKIKKDLEPHQLGIMISQALKTQKEPENVINEMVLDAIRNNIKYHEAIKKVNSITVNQVMAWIVGILGAFFAGGGLQYFK
ncbi:hypothetical protein [Candidatus Bodocaedibacter vickermanii]|uniref:Uncharacterized protein n=1 Tax=Candidatus Bodocaedibacter vickermanii TaxID=2741701 RepID=A0A7L9RUA0_9PROT|nr:hypothetical protein CPBP_00907 [Candidatus Paracaedibacteraceae bacterium 'Lake Konstanz']